MYQNVNESRHSLIWSRRPKQRLEVSVSVGVGEFNKGAQASQNFLEALGLTVGCLTQKFGKKRDQERKRKAEKAVEKNCQKKETSEKVGSEQRG